MSVDKFNFKKYIHFFILSNSHKSKHYLNYTYKDNHQFIFLKVSPIIIEVSNGINFNY